MTPGASPIHVKILLGTRIRRPQCERGACQEKENGDACFSVAHPDTVVHASTPPACDFFPGHRQPPFNEITLVSSSNEPPIGERTPNRSLSVAGPSNSLFAGLYFNNVTLISPLPSVVFCGITTQQFDIATQSNIYCPW
jgi:hypothetical protein